MTPSLEPLHIDTLLRVYLVVTALLALVAWGGARHLRQERSLNLWAGAFGVAALTQALRQALLLCGVAKPWLAVGHLGGIWLAALMLVGLQVYLKQRSHARMVGAVSLSASIACIALAMSAGALWPSLALSTAVAALWSGSAGWLAWQAWRREGGFPWALMTGSLWLSTGVSVMRALDATPFIFVRDDPTQRFNAVGLLMVLALTLLQALAMLLLLQDRALRQIERLIEVDVLTGLLNRRGFDERLRRLLRRGGPHLPVLAVLDVDHFKRINDTHGHAVGDAVLSGIGERLRETLRPLDLAVRLGGEEFAVIWAQPEAGGEARLGERLREAVGATAFATTAGPLAVTVSVGVTRAREAGEAPEVVFSRADAALYEAKRGGRDRVELAA